MKDNYERNIINDLSKLIKSIIKDSPLNITFFIVSFFLFGINYINDYVYLFFLKVNIQYDDISTKLNIYTYLFNCLSLLIIIFIYNIQYQINKLKLSIKRIFLQFCIFIFKLLLAAISLFLLSKFNSYSNILMFIISSIIYYFFIKFINYIYHRNTIPCIKNVYCDLTKSEMTKEEKRINILFLSVIIIIICLFSGFIRYKTQKNFIIINDQYVAVYRTNDYYIVANCTIENDTVFIDTNSYQYYNINNTFLNEQNFKKVIYLN